MCLYWGFALLHAKWYTNQPPSHIVGPNPTKWASIKSKSRRRLDESVTCVVKKKKWKIPRVELFGEHRKSYLNFNKAKFKLFAASYFYLSLKTNQPKNVNCVKQKPQEFLRLYIYTVWVSRWVFAWVVLRPCKHKSEQLIRNRTFSIHLSLSMSDKLQCAGSATYCNWCLIFRLFVTIDNR